MTRRIVPLAAAALLAACAGSPTSADPAARFDTGLIGSTGGRAQDSGLVGPSGGRSEDAGTGWARSWTRGGWERRRRPPDTPASGARSREMMIGG